MMAVSLTTRRIAARVRAGALLSIGAGALMAIGPFLPWVKLTGLTTFDFDGYQQPGSFHFIEGLLFSLLGAVVLIVGVAVVVRPKWARGFSSPVLGVGLLAMVPAVIGWTLVRDSILAALRTQDGNATVVAASSVGIGYWLCVVGALVAITAGLVLRSGTRHCAVKPPLAAQAGE
jgi:hypothetical protein